MQRVLVLFAHPRLEKSRANRVLLRHVPPIDGVTFHDLYELYPDFNVDADAEQKLLLAHDAIVLHHPFYWYSAPPLVKQWIDLVLTFGWAYGPGGTALRGKSLLHAITTGGAEQAYQPDGFHGFTIAEFLRPLQRTATLCGMRWLPPFVVHGTHRITEENLARAGDAYGRMLRALHAGALADADVASFATMNAALEAIA
jgi:glutathione-regulated potassium-efflux system ancillary protein KefG